MSLVIRCPGEPVDACVSWYCRRPLKSKTPCRLDQMPWVDYNIAPHEPLAVCSHRAAVPGVVKLVPCKLASGTGETPVPLLLAIEFSCPVPLRGHE